MNKVTVQDHRYTVQDHRYTFKDYRYSHVRGFNLWKKRRAEDKPAYWFNYFLPPICKIVCRAQGYDFFQLSGPSGICARVWAIFFKDGKAVLSLAFTCDIGSGKVSVTDYSQNTGEYKPGTIGAINGMNHPEVSITPSMKVSELVAIGSDFKDYFEDERKPDDHTKKFRP
jgi:hypothetical protein